MWCLDERTYMDTMGPSATFISIISVVSSPFHFLLFFLPSARFSPPKNTPSLPSAVPAARTPLGERAREMTKGGEREMPPSGRVASAARSMQ